MTASLEQELKEFEKQLSLLLVRFMKIHDQLEASKRVDAPSPIRPAPPSGPSLSKPSRPDPGIAYS